MEHESYLMIRWSIIIQYARVCDELLDGKVGFGGSRHAVEVPIIVREHWT